MNSFFIAIRYYVKDILSDIGDFFKTLFAAKTWMYISLFFLLYDVAYHTFKYAWLFCTAVISFYFLDRIIRQRDWEVAVAEERKKHLKDIMPDLPNRRILTK